MSVDFDAIANALATRFSSANVTAPSGEANIQQSLAALPAVISDEPTVLVYPPTAVELHYGPSVRTGVATYPVRFYIFKVRDVPYNTTLLNKWVGSLYSQLTGQVHLGLTDYVANAVITLIRPGPLTYAGVEFQGIELTCEVNVWEGLAATA